MFPSWRCGCEQGSAVLSSCERFYHGLPRLDRAAPGRSGAWTHRPRPGPSGRRSVLSRRYGHDGAGAAADDRAVGDNSEAFGALSAAAITEADLTAGRFDGAEVQAYLVNWAAPQDFLLQFRGSLGEISRADGSFKAELRGLTELLNRPHGMAYTPGCSAVLGDGRCRFDLRQPGYFADVAVNAADDGRIFTFHDFASFDERWFEGGRFTPISGAASGLVGVVKIDRQTGRERRIELWQSLRAPITAGDMVRIEAGCDKSATTCRVKYSNFPNFRGFPHIPGEDWLASYPVPGRPNGGLRRSGGGGA